MGDRRGNVGAATVLVACVVLLAACSGSGDSAAPVPTLAPSATSSASPTKSTPEQQVEAAVREYYAAMDVAIRTGDIGSFKAITTEDCVCRDFATGVQNIFRGGSTSGAGVSVVRIKDANAHDRIGAATATVKTAAYTVTTKNGVQRSYPGGSDEALVGLVRSAASADWKVESITFLRQRDGE